MADQPDDTTEKRWRTAATEIPTLTDTPYSLTWNQIIRQGSRIGTAEFLIDLADRIDGVFEPGEES